MRKANYVLLIILLLSSLSSNGIAATTTGKTSAQPRFSVTPSFGAFLYNPVAGGTQAGPLMGIKGSYEIIGTSIVDSIGLEGTADFFSTFGGGKNSNGAMLRADVTYLITPRANLVPLIALGVGDMLVSNSGPANSFLINYGVGVKYFFQDWLAYRFDFRHILTYRDVNTRNNIELTAGITYVFGKEHKKRRVKPVIAPIPMAPAVPGIGETEPGAPGAARGEKFDYSILEKLEILGPALYGIGPTPPAFHETPAPTPPTPRPRAYQPEPGETPPPEAPAPPAVQPPAPEETPEQAPEPQARALPTWKAADKKTHLTARRHGQMDVTLEHAPEPARDASEAGQKVVTRVTIGFDFGSSAVRRVYDKKLAQLSAMIRSTPDVLVRIEGQTDSGSHRQGDLSLSIKRARSIRSELVRLGVDPKRIAAVKAAPAKQAANSKSKTKPPAAVAVVTVVTSKPGSKRLAELEEEK